MEKLKIQQDIHNLYHYETHNNVETEGEILTNLHEEIHVTITSPDVKQEELTIEVLSICPECGEDLDDIKFTIETSRLTFKEDIDHARSVRSVS